MAEKISQLNSTVSELMDCNKKLQEKLNQMENSNKELEETVKKIQKELAYEKAKNLKESDDSNSLPLMKK